MKDYYHVLGLDASCTKEEVVEAYLKLSEKFHPDKNPGDSYFENRFREINEAYQTLSDPEKRTEFDEELNATINPHQLYARQYRLKRGKIRRRRIGAGLKVALTLIALIFGIYLFKYLSKSRDPVKTYPVQTVPVAVHKHHHHKHLQPNKIADTSAKHEFVEETAPAKPLVPLPRPPKIPAALQVSARPAPIKSAIVKTRVDSSVVNTHKNFLYATYVHPNVTGIVPLRAKNNFGAPVIASIPAHKKVLVLERGTDYYRVYYDNNIGFVPRWSLMDK